MTITITAFERSPDDASSFRLKLEDGKSIKVDLDKLIVEFE